MKNLVIAAVVSVLLSIGLFAQAPSSTKPAVTAPPNKSETKANAKPKKKIFRPNRTQINEARKILNDMG
ncbi:MAG: hypothetical protein WBD22_07680, partial [Pyrinomonadaceae bacterium]